MIYIYNIYVYISDIYQIYIIYIYNYIYISCINNNIVDVDVSMFMHFWLRWGYDSHVAVSEDVDCLDSSPPKFGLN